MKSKKKKIDEFDGLTEMQKLFCDAYLTSGNGTKSAVLAGYSETSAHTAASRLIKNPKITKYLNHLKQERAVSTDIEEEHVLAMVANLANPTSGATHTIQLKALELLMKHFGMLVDRKEITNETSISIHNPELLSDKEINKLLSQYENEIGYIDAEFEVLEDKK